MNTETKEKLIQMTTDLRTAEFCSGWAHAICDPRADEETKKTDKIFHEIFVLIYS